MARRNNVDVYVLQKMVEEIQKDPSKGKRTNKVEGVWNLQEGMVQFTSEISFEGGTLKVEADQPTFQGGSGLKPGPMHYCLYGLASCFTATFATMAAMEGIELQELKTVVESDVNFSRAMGLSEEAIIEEVRISLSVCSDVPREKIQEVAQLAEERCPAAYCMTKPIELKTEVTTI